MTATAVPPPAAAYGSTGEHLAAAAFDLARRFGSGATLYCAAPRWPSHARHVAVEFVHPVIVGKRALPAVALSAPDPSAGLRTRTRPGDVLMVMGTGGDPVVRGLLRRAEAWSLTTILIAVGDRSDPVRADHVLALDGADPDLAPWDGRLVVLYHLLWELTHVVFEHPGLLEANPPCSGDRCMTCSDEGRVAEIRSVQGGRATVVVAGRTEEADISLVAPVGPDDLVLVHAGVALQVLGDGEP